MRRNMRGLALAAFTAVAARAGAQPPGPETVIDFEDLAPNTQASSRYESKGVVFDPQGWLPWGVAVASSQAASGTRVASIMCTPACTAEFPLASVRGIFRGSSRTYVKVVVGGYSFEKGKRDIAVLTLTAYDGAGTAVAQSPPTTVDLKFGVRTRLEARSASSDIASFVITARPEADPNKLVAIDDLAFDTPPLPPPDFALQAIPKVVTLLQGKSVTVNVTADRLNGAAGAIALSVAGLPAGVTASFDPPTLGDAGSSTLTLNAGETAPVNSAPQAVTVTGTPTSTTAGAAARSADVLLNVRAHFTLVPAKRPTTHGGAVVGCATYVVPFKVVRDFGFTGIVTFDLVSLPPAIRAVVFPKFVDFRATGDGAVDAAVTFTADPGTSFPKDISSLGVLSVVGRSPGVPPSEFAVDLRAGRAAITSFSPTIGDTPKDLKPGTEITVNGRGFCPDSLVRFGNSFAQVNPKSVGPDGDVMKVVVPRLATSGPLSVSLTPADNAPDRSTSAMSLAVRSYRNTNGYSFHNPSGIDVEFDDVEELFGYDQTHLSFDFCFPFGCNVPTPIPSPLAAAFTGIARAALDDGQCHGVSLSTQRIMHGDRTLASFRPQGAATLWELARPGLAPDPLPTQESDIVHYAHVQHITQLSAEYVHHYIGRSAAFSFTTSGDIRAQVRSALLNGDHPYIAMRQDGKGHVVVAYNVEDLGPAGADGFYIDVYDSNFQFDRLEDTDGLVHARKEGFVDPETGVELGSRIHVFPDGHWYSPHHNDGKPWSGGFDTIVVADYSVVPVTPTMPASFKGLLTIIFGDAARTSQITDAAGHRLLDATGSINRDPGSAMPRATRFAPLEDEGDGDSNIYALAGEGPYTQTVAGTAEGTYTNAAFSWDGVSRLRTAASKGSADQITRRQGLAGLTFKSDASAKRFSADVITAAPDQSQRRFVLDTSSSREGDTLAFDARRDSVTLEHLGRPGTCTFSLEWAGKEGPPASMTSPALSLERGDRITITPRDWTRLNDAPIELRVARRGKVRTSTLPPSADAGRLRITALTAQQGPGGEQRLRIESNLEVAPEPSDFLVVSWNLMSRGRSVQRHVSQIAPGKVREGPRVDDWVLTEGAAGDFELVGRVALVRPGVLTDSFTATATSPVTLRR